jgi:hypothetical protein
MLMLSGNFLRVAFLPSFRDDFIKAQATITRLTNHLVLEVNTAGLVAADKRHQELHNLLSRSGTSSLADNPKPVLPRYFLQDMVRNERFFGRSDVLENVTRTLADTDRRLCSVTIHGIGGCGKSETALEWTYRHLDDYQIVLWLYSDATAKLENQLSKIALDLGLVTDPKSVGGNCQALMQWLSITRKLLWNNASMISE